MIKNCVLISILCLLLLCGCANQTASEINEPTESQHETKESDSTEETEVSKHPDMVECASIEGVVTSDSNSPHQIYLRKYRNDQTDSYDLYIEVNTGQQMIKKELESSVILASPESTLSLGDVDGDGTKEILVHYDTGGLGGFGIWMTWVLKVENDSIHILFENFMEFDTGFESCFLDGYQMEVKNNITGYTLVYSIKDRENLSTHNIKMDPFFVFEPKDVDSDGISEIICKQYTYYSFHNDYAGIACSVLKFNNQAQAFEVIDAWYEPNTKEAAHTQATETQTMEDKTIVQKTEYFEVFQTSDQLNYCNFYDKKGILIKQEGPMTKIPTVCFVDDNLIKFSLQAGTGTATNWGYYFDVEQEKFSEVFSSIFDEQNTRVVYVTTNEVVVRDIFDINQYYKIISNFSKDFSPVANPFTDIQFSEDGNSLFVTYFTGDNYEETTETFVLTEEVQSKNCIAVEFHDTTEWSPQEQVFLEGMVESWLSEYTGEAIDLVITENDNRQESDQKESYTVDLTGETTYRSDSLISVIFQGMIQYEQAAHPNHVFFSMNFDPRTLEQVPLGSLHTIDAELYQAFAKVGEQNILDECGGDWPENFGEFSEVFCSQEEFIQGLQENCPQSSRVYYYYTEDGIGFSYSVVYTLGGHKEVELLRTDLE